jgi:hypothetical protein
MIRQLYAWEKDGTFFLSAFIRPLDGRRPAMEFDTKLEVETEVRRRGVELLWQVDGHE